MISMSIILFSITLVISILVLAKGSDMFTEGSKELAHILKITYTVVGILVVSISTTLPENTVSIYSAATGSPSVAFGNAIGSIIFNVGVALAVNGIIRKGNVLDKHVYFEDVPVMIVMTILAWIFSYLDGMLSRLEGLTLLLIGISYYVYRLRSSREVSNDANNEKHDIKKVIIMLLLGLLMVILGSVGLKESGVNLARAIGVPEVYISIIIIAVGTSIPELATSIASAIKGIGEISVGNVIGANIIDISIALGLAAVICPISADAPSLELTYPATVIIFLILEIGLLLRKRVDRILGVALIIAYSIYVYLLSVSYIL
ncbi:MAG: sodium:calcium antiporter [Euryarchaeota archaeon]|nr:sodium:calcium antiporter [Euryarchaeota archaeon]